MSAGRANARVRKAITLQASKLNVVGALGSRFSGEQQGTANEPAHMSLRRRVVFPKGKRKLDLVTTMIQLGVYQYNGVQRHSVISSWTHAIFTLSPERMRPFHMYCRLYCQLLAFLPCLACNTCTVRSCCTMSALNFTER